MLDWAGIWGEFFKYVICTFICVDSHASISNMNSKLLNAMLQICKYYAYVL